MRRLLYCLLILPVFFIAALADEPVWQTLTYAPAPADNPLKGLVPYMDAPNPDGFPHSMAFSYFPLSAVMTGPDSFDWRTLDRFLDRVAARGNQAVFRFYVEYPGKTGSIPDFLLAQGLRVTRFQRPGTPPRPPVENETPDYENSALREAMQAFIRALGKRYDGDPRIGFITAGLLGMWGEWHDSPRDALFASKNVQREIMDAYAASFHKTRILLRYPSGQADEVYAGNVSGAFGYHDDSFAWGTLGTRSWHFMTRMHSAGPAALDRWRTQPIGGEIRPEAWGLVFDAQPGKPEIEDFRACVDATHATWLMDSGMFRQRNPEARRTSAIEEVRHMGYEFHVPRAALRMEGNTLRLAFTIENRGVAPFYYAWPLEFALLDAHGKLSRLPSTATIAGILPGSPRQEEQSFAPGGLQTGDYRVLLRLPNPLPGGKPVRFANTAQDKDMDGWLTLGTVTYH